MLLIALLACGPEPLDIDPPEGFDTWPIPADDQREGDAAVGENYLLYGDYVGSGVPLETWQDLVPASSSNPLGRDGDSATVPYVFNVFEAPNGVEVVGGINCFGCHSGVLEGEVVIGLGDAFSDFTEPNVATFELAARAVETKFGEDSPEYEAFEPLLLGAQATADYAIAPSGGLNPAFMLEEAAAAHRRPGDLSWSRTPLYDKPTSPISSDVPPWWNVKKKNALYYNGMGRGDFARMLMQISLVGLTDLAQAEAIDAQMPDALAFLESLEPPVYTGTINDDLASDGQAVFEANCTHCHGTYSSDPSAETYPNLLVSVDTVGTDPAYADHPMSNELTPWYNRSWFSEDGASRIAPFRGYIAPPLDGIWASAPYFHNGSVPDLVGVITPSERPDVWSRTGAYDHERMGLAWQVEPIEDYEFFSYDTSLDGYGNGGHTFAADLSEPDKQALLEYLKTL